MQLAVSANSEEMVKTLLKIGADPNSMVSTYVTNKINKPVLTRFTNLFYKSVLIRFTSRPVLKVLMAYPML